MYNPLNTNFCYSFISFCFNLHYIRVEGPSYSGTRLLNGLVHPTSAPPAQLLLRSAEENTAPLHRRRRLQKPYFPGFQSGYPGATDSDLRLGCLNLVLRSSYPIYPLATHSCLILPLTPVTGLFSAEPRNFALVRIRWNSKFW